MAQSERQTQFQIVTSAKARAEAFSSLLGKQHVTQVLPHFTEDIMRKPINTQPAEWPIEMAETKAFQDIAALYVLSYLDGTINTGVLGETKPDGNRTIRIYSDTINIAYSNESTDDITMVLEKPKNIDTWVIDRERGALALSGKHTELCTALTAIDLTDPTVHPRTILMRTAVKMKPFTQEDIEKFITRHGEDAILKSASGISFINESVELFDTSYPLRIYIQTDPNVPPSLVTELPTWDHLTQEQRQRILYGAIPESIHTLTHQFPDARPSRYSRSTAKRYDSHPPQTT